MRMANSTTKAATRNVSSFVNTLVGCMTINQKEKSMIVLYSAEDQERSIKIENGGLMLVFSADEMELQHLIMQGFLPIVDGHTRAQIAEIISIIGRPPVVLS